MDLTWIYDFLALAEHSNFSRAAEARHITQPAFSRRIKALESWVGVSLFDRNTHIVTLTNAGESFRPAAEESLRRILEGREDAKEEGGIVAPTLRFAATHTVAITFFSNWIHALSSKVERKEKIQLFSNTTQACERMMIEGQAQFFLYHHHSSLEMNLKSPYFKSVCIGYDELIPVSAPDSNGQPILTLPGSPSSPIAHLSYGEQSGINRILQAALSGQPSPIWLKSVFASHMATVLASVAREGTGLAWCPLSLVKDDLESGSLVRAKDNSWDVPIQIQILRPRSRQSSAAEELWHRIVSKTE